MRFMDDQQTYLLNGLIARQFGLGRIVRFRAVKRGRQAAAFELFTTQEKEYLVQLYPPVFPEWQLEFMADVVNLLDAQRFSVVPFVKKKGEELGESFVGEGPQGTRMMVSLAPQGSVLTPEEITTHDISQLGLRLAWMHRMFHEQIGPPPQQAIVGGTLPDRLRDAQLLNVDEAALQNLIVMLAMPVTRGWAHGDLSPAALLFDADHQIRTVTDWGLLHAGSPLEDLVDAFVLICTGGERSLLAQRGRALLEAYDSLVPIARVPWTPVVASWCAQRLLDAAARRRAWPDGFENLLRNPENLATALAGSL